MLIPITNERYHTKCYETSCHMNIDDKCCIPTKDEFEKHCPFKIVERHESRMKDELKEGERLLSKHHKLLIKEMEKES